MRNPFAELLTKAIKRIHAQEGKHIGTIQNELDDVLGRSGQGTIGGWRKNSAKPPAYLEDIQILSQELVRRNGLETLNELKQFLKYAEYGRYADIEDWCKKLAPLFSRPNSTTNDKQSFANHTLFSSFIAGPPIHHPRQFFGRMETLENMFRVWKAIPLQNISIIGRKRSGKTSLLHYLRQIAAIPTHQLRPDQHNHSFRKLTGYQWVFIDFQNPRLCQRETLLRYILTSCYLPVPEPCTLSNFFRVVEDNLHHPTLILFDEIAVALKAPELDQQFWDGLRSLGSNYTEGKLGFCITAPESPTNLAYEQGKSSPFFNIFGQTEFLGPLTESETGALINSSPKPFAEADVKWILEQSYCWPIIVQTLCQIRLATLEQGKNNEQWKQQGLKAIMAYQHLLEE